MARHFQIRELTKREDYLADLLGIWEASVRASHDFLSEAAIQAIKAEVPGGLMGVAQLVLAWSAAGELVGFMGIDGENLEMLFLHPNAWRLGLGRALIEEGLTAYGLRQLTVNEQNPQAVAFYQHMGFRPYRRTEQDEAGRPYPLLYMRYVG
ncbi:MULTISPECIES: GNAT family N-acetyltransferase [Aerococcus]|uniref:GNAT family N-acetyltransferase n=1 Tax=Aerococcus sanguinicola TaxID=119206 RepID=A0A5N1GKH0_9LACT|nr:MULTISPECIES: GNAT family N-acetyltransferase [Aerococcus]KAA9300511.1 GNAT family N-acetyltransferase [Aerococcus sanguinicola]MDK6369673.1 GNAT family N-acetyltransferase [Aerococcus sp. UMB9870]MDK6680311.1 GNAT family N-acetyltransferase [Aerococcus sp. UMB8608]MDK6686891.1 GNAT family N-acetyltransferase [Aerococcus sp. UMB8623]MDK6940002.1 GNAT family N-acetyltransferase [Aerococcus sp. UMB8487]